MMLDAVLDAVRTIKGISDWQCTWTHALSSERYFVRRRLDMSRASLVEQVEATLFVDAKAEGKRMRGASTCRLSPGMTAAEMGESLGRCAFAAGKAMSPWFPLPEGGVPSHAHGPSSMPGDPEPWLDAAERAIFASAESSASSINSLELFFRRTERRILTSRGVDASDAADRISVELIVEHPGEANGVELFTTFERSTVDEAELSSIVADQLSLVAERARAIPTPSTEGLPLILTRDAIPLFFSFFVDRASAHMVYRKVSDWMPGYRLDASGPLADPLTITADPNLPLPAASPFDLEGRPLSRTVLIEGSAVRTLLGTSRYAHYLGIAPTGAHYAYAVEGGALPAAELRLGEHLEVASFSDFQMDAVTGTFGGEIRLGWLVKEGKRIPVTGGSVTGRVEDNLRSMRLSAERELFSVDNYHGGSILSLGWLAPSSIRLVAVSIAGKS